MPRYILTLYIYFVGSTQFSPALGRQPGGSVYQSRQAYKVHIYVYALCIYYLIVDKRIVVDSAFVVERFQIVLFFFHFENLSINTL